MEQIVQQLSEEYADHLASQADEHGRIQKVNFGKSVALNNNYYLFYSLTLLPVHVVAATKEF